MSIFSSKRRYHVDTTAVRVIESTQIPRSNINGIINSVMQQTPITESIKRETLNGSFRQFEQMYYHALKPDNYIHGLPDVRFRSSDEGYELAKAAIEGMETDPVVIDYIHFRPLNNIHVGWQIITDELGYDDVTNELVVLSTEVGHTVYLKNMVARYVIPEEGDETQGRPGRTSRSSFGKSPTSGNAPRRPGRGSNQDLQRLVQSQNWEESTTGQEGVTIEWVWEDAAGTVHEASEFRELETDYDNTVEYYQARYRVTAGGITTVKYWTYNPADGLHPGLDTVYQYSYTNPGTYFPFAIFRRGGINLASQQQSVTVEHKQTAELLDKIGIDYREMGDQIDANPDVAEIDQATLMMAIPVNTQDEEGIEYLHRFFSWVHSNADITQETSTEQIMSGPGVRENYALEFADGGFRVVMSYDDLTWRRRAGSSQEKGHYWAETVEDEVPDSPGAPGGKRIRIYYRHQVTESVYEEVMVENPVMRYDIQEDHEVAGEGTDDNCLIPLNFEIAQSMTLLKKERLYYLSLHLVFNSVVVEKVRWYQRGAFRAVLTIVAVVIAFKTGYYQGIIAAIQAGAATEVAIALAVMYIKQMIAVYVFEVIVGAIGIEAGLILALAVAFTGGAIGVFGAEAQAGWAERLLQSSVGLTQGVQENLQTAFAKYQSELSEFQLMAEQKWEELEEVNKLLDTPEILDPFAFIGLTPQLNLGESPDSLYARTVHSGNVGALGYDFVESFVDISLTLPTIQQTLGATNNGLQ